MGLGTLIIFIALLITATVAAGVFIQTTQSLQEKSLTTGDEAQGNVVTTVEIVDISATDGLDSNITEMMMILRLSPGSRSIDFGSSLLSMSTDTHTAILQYKGPNGAFTKGNTGYNTWNVQEIGEIGVGYDPVQSRLRSTAWTNLEIDLDLDGTNDKAIICENGRPGNPCDGQPALHGRYIYFNLTEDADVLAPIYDEDGNLMNTCIADFAPYYRGAISIGDDSEYGYYRLVDTGINNGACRIGPNNVTIYQGVILNEDLDDDKRDDTVFIRNATHLMLDVSGIGLISYPMGVNLSTGAQDLDVDIDLKKRVDGTTLDLGDIVIEGKTSRADYIDENVTFTVIPQNLGQGYFTAEYLQTGKNHIPGVFQTGDMVKVYFESPNEIGEGAQVRVNFLPKNGVAKTAMFYTPDVMVDFNIHLYP